MIKVIAAWLLTILSAVAVQACAQSPMRSFPSLDSIQGAWWSDCQEPAAEFVVNGNEYSGDFAGTYKLQLTGNVLELKEGLVDGHSINVTHKPLSFLILKAVPGRLVLRAMPGNAHAGDWHLKSCESVPPDN